MPSRVASSLRLGPPQSSRSQRYTRFETTCRQMQQDWQVSDGMLHLGFAIAAGPLTMLAQGRGTLAVSAKAYSLTLSHKCVPTQQEWLESHLKQAIRAPKAALWPTARGHTRTRRAKGSVWTDLQGLYADPTLRLSLSQQHMQPHPQAAPLVLQGRALARTEGDLRAEEKETRRLRREQKGTQLQLDAVARRAQQLEQDLQAVQAQEAELQRKLVDSGAEVTSAGWHAPLCSALREACWHPELADKGAGVRSVGCADSLAGWSGNREFAVTGGRSWPDSPCLLCNWQLRLTDSSKVDQAG